MTEDEILARLREICAQSNAPKKPSAEFVVYVRPFDHGHFEARIWSAEFQPYGYFDLTAASAEEALDRLERRAAAKRRESMTAEAMGDMEYASWSQS